MRRSLLLCTILGVGCAVYLPSAGTYVYCDGGFCGTSGGASTNSGGSTGGGTIGGSTTGTTTGTSGGTGSSGTSGGGASSAGSTGGASTGTTGGTDAGPCYCPTCSATQGGIPLGPADGGLTPRSGLATVFVAGHLIFAIGGEDSCGNETGLIEVYDTGSPGLGWQHAMDSTQAIVPDLPLLDTSTIFLSAVGLQVIDGGPGPFGLVAIGGNARGGFSDAALAFSTGESFWSSEGSLPFPLYQAAAVVDANGCIDVIGGLWVTADGGLGGNATSAIETLCQPFNSSGQPSGAAWTSSAVSLPTTLAGEAAAQDDAGNTYVIGGDTTNGPSTSVYEIDPVFASVVSMASTTNPHYAGGAAAVGTKIYAIGGAANVLSSATSVVEVFDMGNAAAGWTSPLGLSLNLAREFFGTVTDAAGNIYVIGGRAADAQTVYGNMEVFAPAAASWVLVP